MAQNLISDLPDNVLYRIISFLSIDEVFRTSILSKRWKHLYKSPINLDFDWTYMKCFEGKRHKKYNEIVHTTLNKHIGCLTSCCFKHLPESFGHLKNWVEFVIERKNISSLSLKCKPPIGNGLNYLVANPIGNSLKSPLEFKPMMFSNLCSLELTNYHLQKSSLSAFKSCNKLKVLKLKKVFMGSTIINGILQICCALEKFSLIESKFDSLKIEHQNLKILELISLNIKKMLYVNVKKLLKFSYSCNSNSTIKNQSQEFLKTRDVLNNCSNFSRTGSTNIFPNLLSLSIDLDLNNIKEALALSNALLSCVQLNTLEITIPVESASKSCATSNDCDLHDSNSIIWETEEREEYYFVLYTKLKYVKVKGFTGKENEVKFVKLWITNAKIMEKMYIICDSKFMDKARELLSLPRGSSCLNIVLKSE